MCGIVGILNLSHQQNVDQEILHKMNHSQTHRGPDEFGIHLEPNVGLGHRRLSIIDLSSGKQPLYNEDNTVVVVYNGEIYNFQETAKELIKLGHTFKTRCDTEVIVHAWEEWGKNCVSKFRGMFAFAVWDKNKQVLFLGRDRLGIKPLYYTILPNGQFVFASEMKALLHQPSLAKTIDPISVENYFAYGYVPDPESIFKSVKKLAPGHILTISPNQEIPHVEQYWDVEFAEDHSLNEKELSEELISRLREAVDIRLISEVPLGAFLSGGVDSSAVVALMAEINPDPVNTCSISFGESEFDESEYAQMVAEKYETNHHSLKVKSDSFDLVDTLAEIYDEPFADSSAIPTYKVCELARQKVTVALSGDGGDENLAGYRRYKWHVMEERMRSLIPSALRTPVFGLLGSAYPKLDWAPKIFRAKTTFQSLARNSLLGYFHNVSVVGDSVREKIFSQDFKSSLQGYAAVDLLHNYANKSGIDHPLSLVQYLDLKTYLAGDILTKVDRASMAHSLEVRVPILDHHLVEWMATIPPGYKLQNGQGKYIFKKALESRIPNDILYRRKMGFAVPLSDWFRGPLKSRVQEALCGESMLDSGIFNADGVRKIVDDHISSRFDHSAIVWSLLMYEAFQRRMSVS